MTLSDTVKPLDQYMGMFIGPQGSGKKIAAMSFPDPLLLDFDSRMQSAVNHYRGKVRFPFESFGPYDYLKFDKFTEDFEKQGKTHTWDGLPVKTVVAASLTGFARMSLNYMLELRGGDAKPNPQSRTQARAVAAQAADDKKKERARDDYKHKGVIDLFELEDFGGEARAIGLLVDFFRDQKVHFILTGHMTLVTYHDIVAKKEITVQQLLTGGKKVAAEVPSYFNEIYFFRNDEQADSRLAPKRMARTRQGIGAPFAKTALPIPVELDLTTRSLYPYLVELLKEQGVEVA